MSPHFLREGARARAQWTATCSAAMPRPGRDGPGEPAAPPARVYALRCPVEARALQQAVGFPRPSVDRLCDLPGVVLQRGIDVRAGEVVGQLALDLVED